MHLPHFPLRPRDGVKWELRDTDTSDDSLFWLPFLLWVSGKISLWQRSTICMRLSAAERGLEFHSWFHYRIDRKVWHLRVWLGRLPEWRCHSETMFCGKNCKMTACLWSNGNCNQALEESVLQKEQSWGRAGGTAGKRPGVHQPQTSAGARGDPAPRLTYNRSKKTLGLRTPKVSSLLYDQLSLRCHLENSEEARRGMHN